LLADEVAQIFLHRMALSTLEELVRQAPDVYRAQRSAEPWVASLSQGRHAGHDPYLGLASSKSRSRTNQQRMRDTKASSYPTL